MTSVNVVGESFGINQVGLTTADCRLDEFFEGLDVLCIGMAAM